MLICIYSVICNDEENAEMWNDSRVRGARSNTSSNQGECDRNGFSRRRSQQNEHDTTYGGESF